jgi:hypothetical protein
MASKALILSETAHSVLLELITGQIVQQAQALAQLDKKKQPNEYGLCLTGLNELTGLHAQLTEKIPTLPSTYKDPLEEHERRVNEATRTRMLAAGLDPDRDDPRALDPSCVHGRKFTEPCPKCEANEPPAQPPSQANERPDVGIIGIGDMLDD